MSLRAATGPILVTGATGMQGGAVLRALLARGHRVRAFVRDTSAPRAAALAALGAELAPGQFDEPSTVAAAATGCHAIFVLGTPFEAGADAETRQAIAVIDAALGAGVEHVVYSSVGSADRRTGIPHFESKRRVEEHLARVTATYTIVAPVNFRENFAGTGDVLAMPLPPDRALQTISAPELGAFVASVIRRGSMLYGHRIDLGSDATTGPAMAAALGARYEETAPGDDDGDMTRMWRWFAEVGYAADIAGLRAAFPEVPWTTFAEWARSSRG